MLDFVKNLGVGTAKQNWKQVKLMKSGQQSNISLAKGQKQVTLYGQNQQLKASARAVKLSLVGKLWEDKDFKTMKMDMYCRDMWELLKVLPVRGPERMFRNWQEGWEIPTKNLGPMGEVILLEKLKRKYVGFKLSYNEGIVPKVYLVHSIMFQNMTRPRKYMIVGVKLEFDVTMDNEDNDSDTYNVWDC
jgi:hypothetical protein